MAKRGRSLELIISSLEKLLSNSDIEIKSPDKLYDKNINDHREVDISIKGKIGSHKILIIIECKDFNIPLNIIHIEQLKTKRDALNANKLIVVSKNGFSKNATEFAKKHGIEIRKLSEINENIIENWISRIEFIDISNNYTVNKIIFKLAEKNNLDYMDQSFDNIKLIENVGKGKLNDRDEIFLDNLIVFVTANNYFTSTKS